ncbi:MAG: LysR family transcriptional regulator [Lachnospiraceae bacterium]|nr:LysR family transcriptional regulator [Lachnospiraceae bacterium]MBR5994864.1 LysR family transcriptional regulator [Lachnospiraceae bacterium]MCR4678597.1 LysR family transcriptional regulator [Lachnospiraceae bacterium]
MNINQLKYVLEVAASSSMREAATRLFVTQPALSASIRELEEELGIHIFNRTNKGISLTPEGREFIVYAKKSVGQYAILEDRYLSANRNRERFSVSTQHYNFAIRSFTEVIRKFSPEKFLFSIHETKTRDVLEHVRDMKSEVGIVSYSSANEAVLKKLLKEYQLDFVPLMTRAAYAYVWKDHPYAGRDVVSLEELKKFPCVAFDQSDDSNFYLTEEAMADYDFEKMIRSDDRATTMEILAELNGYSIGSGMLSGDDVILQGLTAIKLKEEDPLIIGYITRSGAELSKYGQEYVNDLQRFREI